MLFRSGKSWVVDFFVSRGWLVKRRGLRRRANHWNLHASVAAECLEDRTLLSTITVTGLTDGTSVASGVTLRDAIQAANTDTSIHGSVAGEAGVQNVIVFQAGLTGSILLDPAQGALTISSSMKIEGLGAPNTIIDAQQNSRVIDISAGTENVTLNGLTITGGKATAINQPGGGIRFLSTGSLLVENSAISGNTSTGAPGGGIYTNTGVLTVLDSTVSGNSISADHMDGGGIYAQSGNVVVTNSTLSGNSVGGVYGDGGAVYAMNGNVTLTNSTVTKNSTGGGNSEGGGIKTVRGSLTLLNSIVSGNTIHPSPYTSSDVKFVNYAGSATFTAKHSLIGVNSDTPLAPAPVGSPDANGNLVGTFASPLDARLGVLADNGGQTQTCTLLLGSPAINAGFNSLAVAADSTPLTTDQRGTGFPRVNNGTVDMGSFEFLVPNFPLVVTTASDVLDANVPDPSNLSLRDAVALANELPGAAQITFSSSLSGVPIDLALGELLFTDAVQIDGLGAKNTIIDAQRNSRVFDVTSGAGNMTINNLTITGGKTTASNDAGGGIRFLAAGSLLIENSAVAGNTTTGDSAPGAGIYSKTGPVTLLNSTMSGNLADGYNPRGGAIFDKDGNVVLTNSTLYANTVGGIYGGGAGIYAVNGNVTLTNSTVTKNATQGGNSNGGGIATGRGSLTLLNSIVSGNTIHPSPDTASDISFVNYSGTATFTAKNSLIGINSGTPLNPAPIGSPDANGNLVGTFASPLNAQLGPLADNGGQTQTVALLAGSPAINAGSNALANDPGPDHIAGTADDTPLTTDQRGAGFARVLNGTVDMGAYEFQTLANPTVNFIATNSHLPVLTGTWDQTTPGGATQLQVTVNGTTFTLGLNSQLTSDGSGHWTLTTTAAIPDGTYTVQVHTATAVGNVADATAVNALVIDTTAPATTVLAGEYAVSTNGSGTPTLASIVPTGTQLVLIGSTVAVATATSPTQLQFGGATATYADSRITFGSSGPFANQVWTKLDLPANYTTARGTATHVNTNGNSITCVDENGTPSAAVWINPTQLTAFGLIATVGNGKLTWSNGTVWYENVSLNGSLNGAGTVNISASPSRFAVTDYSFAGQTAHVIQNGTNSVVFVNEHGSFAVGSWINAIQAIVPAWGNDVATFINGNAYWSDGSVWTLATTAAPQITVTEYTIASRTARLIQNGTNTAVFINENGAIVLGTLTSPAQAVVAAWNSDVATFTSGNVDWSDGSVWNLATSAPPPISVSDYSIGGRTAHLIQNGTNTVAFVNERGAVVLGNWISATQAVVAAWSHDVATFTSGKVNWSDGSVWTLTTAAAPQITVTDYIIPSNGLTAHWVVNGTTTVVFVNEFGNVVLGTLTSPTRAVVAAWGNDVATIGNTNISWSDHSVWNLTPNVPLLLVTVTDATGAVSHVQLLTATTLVGLSGPLRGVRGTRLNGKIFWSNGEVWTNFDLNALNAFFEMGTTYP